MSVAGWAKAVVAVLPVARGLAFRLALAAGGLAAAEIPLATDAPRPLGPEQSASRFQVAPGFRVELVAAEPHLADPVAMAFDARGRIFVCEIHGYNLEGYLDILQLNRTGKLDRAVRRIPAAAEALRKAQKEQYGTVKLLEDRDGDGRVDHSRVWADRLPPCYGVVPARRGVIVLCAPDIVYLADHDGDGTPDQKETLFTGFGVYDMWSRINNPRWGVDNWIYAAGAIQSGGVIRGPHLSGEVPMGATSFRFQADGTAIEPTSGATSGFGLALNDWGDRFLVTNQQHVLFVAPLPHRYLARNPDYAAPNPVVNISTYGHPARVYPTSQPHPWRLARSQDPAWVQFYGVAEATANGFFTAASGQVIYRANRFGPEFRGNHFSVDNAQNLVHRCLLEPQGTGHAARRPEGERRREFLTSTDRWFRPVNLVVGPDGALYVVDMYREIIEDYSAIPRYLQQIYVQSLVAGADRGRIWRIVPEGPERAVRVDLDSASVPQLVAELANPNAWWRLTAQRLLVERGDAAAAPPLAAWATAGRTPQARLHALYALDGLGALTPELVEQALEDEHFAVRMHALRLADRRVPERPGLAGQIVRMVDDPHPRVRLQLALSLGELGTPEAAGALAALATRGGDDPWMRAAILSSSSGTAFDLLVRLVGSASATESGAGRDLVQPLASIIGARHRQEEVDGLLAALAALDPTEGAGLCRTCLEGLVEGLAGARPRGPGSAAARRAIGRLLARGSPEVRRLALQVARLVRSQDAPEAKAALKAAAQTARDSTAPLEERLAAITLLAGAPRDPLGRVAQQLLAPRQPLDLQLAAVEALGAVGDRWAAELLMADWASKTPQVQNAVIDVLFRRREYLLALLDALDRSALPGSSLDTDHRRRLEEHPDEQVRKRARSLAWGTAAGQDRRPVVSRYLKALAGQPDAEAGKRVFQEQCAKCHQLEGQGHAVGPDLASIVRRSDQTLVSDVIDPSNQITAGYGSYTVLTDDGRIFTGVLAAETATSLTLRWEEGQEQTILRRDIDEMAASAISMMPQNLEEAVTPRQLADLIAYLRAAVGPELPAALTLFDEDPEFVGLLTDGQGRAEIETADCYTGQVALRIAPPQRFSQRIPGWEYPIRERPEPGEFRYLRLAWKSAGAEGVMIELAGNGQWPPADQPRWRYYSGANTTGWAARQVAAEAPRQWTVITCDLWQDFGSFTLTGIAPTAMGGDALFDRIELLRHIDEPED